MPQQLLKLTFWMSTNAPSLTLQMLGACLLVCALLFIVGAVFFMRAATCEEAKPHRSVGLRQLGTWCITWSVLGIVWSLLAYEDINLFGAPFWLPIGFLIAVVWLVFIVLYFLRTVPRVQAREAARAAREKYLPKPKK